MQEWASGDMTGNVQGGLWEGHGECWQLVSKMLLDSCRVVTPNEGFSKPAPLEKHHALSSSNICEMGVFGGRGQWQ